MWADLDENLHSGAGEARDRLCQGAGGMCRAFPLRTLESVRDDVGRAFQAEQTDDMGCGHVSDAVADRLSRNDPPGFPQVGQCHLEDELDRSGDLGITDPSRCSIARHRGGRRPSEPGTKDGIKPPDRVAERGLLKEQVSPRTRPGDPPDRKRRRRGRDGVLEVFVPKRCRGGAGPGESDRAPRPLHRGWRRSAPAGDHGGLAGAPRVWATSHKRHVSARIAQDITHLAGEVMKGVGGFRGERDQDLLAITPFTCFRLPDEPRHRRPELPPTPGARWSPQSRKNSLPPPSVGRSRARERAFAARGVASRRTRCGGSVGRNGGSGGFLDDGVPGQA